MRKLFIFILLLSCASICSSQTYLFHESHIANDSLRNYIISDPLNNIYPFERRTCTIKGNVLGKDSMDCFITGDVFNPIDPPCGIQNLYTFNCDDSLNRIVFESVIIKGQYRGNYIVHYSSGYVHISMTLDKDGINGTVYHYYDIPTDKYVGKTYDKGSLMCELEYKNGKIWNIQKQLDPNGKPLKKGNFKNGSGTINLYHPTGRLLRSVEVVDGELNGICIYYYANGGVLMQGNYENNHQKDIWTEYDVSGKVIEQSEYGYGQVISWD